MKMRKPTKIEADDVEAAVEYPNLILAARKEEPDVLWVCFVDDTDRVQAKVALSADMGAQLAMALTQLINVKEPRVN